VRDPLVLLPAASRISMLPVDSQIVLRELLGEIALDARQRAEKCWKTHKAPMAAYWKAVSVYAGHARRLCNPS
jgi:hypothetical protein